MSEQLINLLGISNIFPKEVSTILNNFIIHIYICISIYIYTYILFVRLRAFRLAKVLRHSFVGLWVAGLWRGRVCVCVCVCVFGRLGPKGVIKKARRINC